MLQKTQKAMNDKLRRNIWRSLLIMKTATVPELVGVVSGLTSRNARKLLRELETHGYAGKNVKRNRPEYFQSIDRPALPAVCAHCGRRFDVKACTPKETKTETETETERQKGTPRKKQRDRKRETIVDVIARGIRELTEVTDDAA